MLYKSVLILTTFRNEDERQIKVFRICFRYGLIFTRHFCREILQMNRLPTENEKNKTNRLIRVRVLGNVKEGKQRLAQLW